MAGLCTCLQLAPLHAARAGGFPQLRNRTRGFKNSVRIQVVRKSDMAGLDIAVDRNSGFARASDQDAFCAASSCYTLRIYDQACGQPETCFVACIVIRPKRILHRCENVLDRGGVSLALATAKTILTVGDSMSDSVEFCCGAE